MKKHLLPFLLALCLMPSRHAAAAADDFSAFRFAVIDQPARHRDINLQAALNSIRERSLAFVVTNGIRAEDEACTDTLFRERKTLLETADKPLFLSLAGSDWIGCKNEKGEDARIERLQRLRELLSEDDTSFGMQKIPLHRQSLSAKYRDFPENTYWQHGAILFATLHIPANNNHYLSAAGRNNEFEERLVANHDWLQRLFTLAKRRKLAGIVIFCDGNPLESRAFKKVAPRDGFHELKQWIIEQTFSFPGKVLVVHGQSREGQPAITWRNNLGVIGTSASWLEIGVSPKTRRLFFIGEPAVAPKKKRR